jgi:hypothetical protein
MSFGEGAGDDGFSGFDNSGNFGGDFGMGDGAVGCGMEVEGGTVGDFGFGGMDGKNDCGMDQGTLVVVIDWIVWIFFILLQHIRLALSIYS